MKTKNIIHRTLYACVINKPDGRTDIATLCETMREAQVFVSTFNRLGRRRQLRASIRRASATVVVHRAGSATVLK